MASQRTLAALASMGLCLFSACGSDDEKSSGGSSTSATKVELKITGSGETAKIEVPEIKAGLVELTLKNTDKAPHSAQLVKVEGDHTAEEAQKVINTEGGPIPEWLSAGAGIGTVPPGKTRTVTQVLEPGTYYLSDDEGEEGAPPKDLVKVPVTGEGGGELPSAPASIVASEYTFKADGLKAGKSRVTFDNAGKELHHIIAFPVNKGASAAEVEKFFSSDEEPSGPPPVDFEKGDSTAVIGGGQKQVTDLELVKGKYALVCFIQDRKGGPPHIAKGMFKEVTVE